ncbi:DUF2254 domain-containing protein [Microbacterium sp. NPDC064584]|uniref:DUF2254 domain-containing protein n=1 Tax=Microbacterium sp. NPDC064584 TaxID=3155817 RepID=UPI00342848FA
MRSWFVRARESFWLLPTLFGIAAICLAWGLTELDRLLQADGTVALPFEAGLSATGGRAILTVIGGTMLGVAATSFSITISVLATTSSTYGPRLVRNFMADRGNQLVLAVLTSTFLYTLVVLGAVRTEQDSTSAFVPLVAVGFAVILAVGDVAVLVYFIHHIAGSVQVTTLQARVSDELRAVIDLVYPESPSAPPAVVTGLQRTNVVRARSTGYVQFVDIDRLVSCARNGDGVLRVTATPGTYVLDGDPIAEWFLLPTAPAASAASDPDHDAHADAVERAFSIDSPRTPHQDLVLAARNLTEIGVRGLASGTNDPYTAQSVIDALTAALVTLCTRPVSMNRIADADGDLRVLCAWPTPDEVMQEVLATLRIYAVPHPLVVSAIVQAMSRLEKVAAGRCRIILRVQSDALRDAFVRTEPAQADAAPILSALDGVRADLASL